MNKFDNYIKQPFEFESELNLLFNSDEELVIFDVGACEGEDSIKFSRRFPNSKIYTFEPLPKNCKIIQDNFFKYHIKNAKLTPCALSNKVGKALFHVSSGRPLNTNDKDWDYGNKSSSLLPPEKTKDVHEWLKFKRKITVKTEKLSTFVKKEGIKEIDFLYMDVQGAEMMVLEGAGKFIRQIKAIWLEVESIELYKNQPLKRDIEEYMKKHNFFKVKDTVDEVAGDQLYVNKEVCSNSKLIKIVGRKGFQELITKANKGIDKIKHTAKRIKKKAIKNQTIKIKDNYKMIVTNDMEWTFVDGSYYEFNVAFWLNRIMTILPNPIFYDVGANLGYYSIVNSDFASKVYAFEPCLKTNKILGRNIELNKIKNVDIVKLGVSNTTETLQLIQYSSIGNNSVYHRNISEDHPLKHIGSERIQLISIDEFTRKKGVLPPSVIKIDIEGGELKALRGARSTLKKHKPIIFFEYSESTTKDAGYNREDIIKLLSKLNYKFFGLTNNYSEMKPVPITSKSSRTRLDIDNVIAVPDKDKALLSLLRGKH